jgi:protein regulator of cytokinesis 1
MWSSQSSAKVQQPPDSENSPAEKDMHAKRNRNSDMQSVLGNNRRCSIPHEDKTSVSTVKQGLSPI